MFFESIRSIGDKVFVATDRDKISFPLHIHRAFEMISQLDGETKVTVNGKDYILTPGKSVLIFPFQQHAYECIKQGKLQLCLFSPDMADDFYVLEKNPTTNEFSFTALPITNEENFYIKKSYVYAIIGSFDKNREYEIGTENSLGVLVDLLMYAEENFCEKCFLKDVARKLGYDYAYLSKIFKRNTTLSFNSYVNTLRINKSKIMLEKTEKSVTQIADECGYSSLRTFNRAFIRAEGQTPSQYKNAQKDRKS